MRASWNITDSRSDRSVNPKLAGQPPANFGFTDRSEREAVMFQLALMGQDHFRLRWRRDTSSANGTRQAPSRNGGGLIPSTATGDGSARSVHSRGTANRRGGGPF